MSNGIVKSILDTDLYKFTTSFAYQKLFPQAQGIFEFKDRNETVWSVGDGIMADLKNELLNLSELRLTPEERDWAISNIPFIPRYYWEWLETFRFDPSDIHYHIDDDGHLHISAGSFEKPLELYKQEETEEQKFLREEDEATFARAYMENMVLAGKNWKK